MYYAASYIPLVKETKVLRWDPSSKRGPGAIKLSSAFDLKEMLEPKDHLWLMMGSTNAAMSLAAFRKEVEVHQISFLRIQSWLKSSGKLGKESAGRGRPKIKPSHVLAAAQETPELFYPMSTRQAEVLEIAAAWQAVSDAMKERKRAANLLRARIYQEGLVYGKARGQGLPSDPKEAKDMLKKILSDLLDTKDEQGRKRSPGDSHIAFLVKEEERRHSELERICHTNAFYQHLFGNLEGVGPMLGARFIAAIERIERFAEPKDLSNYAGMLPRGKEGTLPSRRKGKTLSRSPDLNSSCFLLQNYMFQWGRNSELGQRLIQQVKRECPYTPEQRRKDKNLRRKYVETVKRARIAMTRYFLEDIVWPRWQEYLGLNSQGG